MPLTISRKAEIVHGRKRDSSLGSEVFIVKGEDTITVKVLTIRGSGQITMSIDAPAGYTIVRDDINRRDSTHGKD